MCSKRRRKETTQTAKKPALFWESMVNKYEGRNSELEEKECELQGRLELLEKTAPHRVFYNMWKLMQNESITPSCNNNNSNACHRRRSRESFSRSRERGDSRERSRSPIHHHQQQVKQKSPSNAESKMMLQEYVRTLEDDKGQLTKQKQCMEQMIKDLEMQLHENKANQQTPSYYTISNNNNNTEEDTISIGSVEFDLIKSVQELKERGNEMSKRIEMMEKRETAYLETLKQADEICAEMEIGYKQHCFKAEQNEAEMRDRLQRLKKRDEYERRCSSFGDSVHKNHPRYWSMMFDPICSMLNRWH